MLNYLSGIKILKYQLTKTGSKFLSFSYWFGFGAKKLNNKHITSSCVFFSKLNIVENTYYLKYTPSFT